MVVIVFSPQLILQFTKDQEGVQHFPGGPTFSRRVQMLISIETHITYNFPGGGEGGWIRT